MGDFYNACARGPSGEEVAQRAAQGPRAAARGGPLPPRAPPPRARRRRFNFDWPPTGAIFDPALAQGCPPRPKPGDRDDTKNSAM